MWNPAEGTVLEERAGARPPVLGVPLPGNPTHEQAPAMLVCHEWHLFVAASRRSGTPPASHRAKIDRLVCNKRGE